MRNFRVALAHGSDSMRPHTYAAIAAPVHPRTEAGRARAGRKWLLPLPVAAVLLIAYGLAPAGGPQALVSAAGPGLATLAVVSGILLRRPDRAAPWWAIAAGLAMISLASGTSPSISSIADTLDLAGDVAIAGGLLLFLRRVVDGGAVGGLIDAAILTVGVSLVAWTAWMDPLITSSGLGELQLAAVLAHPAVDVLWFGLTARLLFAPGRRSPAFWLIVAALPFALVADVAHTIEMTNPGFGAGPLRDVGWLLFATTLAMAALHSTMAQPFQPYGRAEDRPTRTRLLLLLGALLLVPAVFAFHGISGEKVDVPMLVAAGAVMAILVMARLGGIAVALRVSLDAQEVMQGQLTHQALHDGLTGLANRIAFMVELDRARSEGKPIAVMFCDLDDFTAVNDTLGQSVGDSLLVALAARLRGPLRPGDLLARVGGDEFGILLHDVEGGAAELAADRILAALREPFEVGGRLLTARASIGIAVSDAAGHTSELTRNAGIALYLAKSEGKGRAQLFRSELHEELTRRQAISADLAAAVEDGQLVLEYQPVVDLKSGRLDGVEALVRWQHPSRGLLPPSEFIAAAEASGLIVPLGAWVLREACRQTVAWGVHRLDGRALSIAVNVSARQLREPPFLESVADALLATGLAPERLVLELTETVLTDATITEAVLARLRATGVRIAIDDFGTGYSSLSYVRRYPVDIVKIDRSFIMELTAGGREAKVTRAIIALAKQLELDTIAEGIETPEQAESLRKLGCHLGQGYLFARPLSPAAIGKLLEARRSEPTTTGEKKGRTIVRRRGAARTAPSEAVGSGKLP